jgi:hypothetical protein
MPLDGLVAQPASQGEVEIVLNGDARSPVSPVWHFRGSLVGRTPPGGKPFPKRCLAEKGSEPKCFLNSATTHKHFGSDPISNKYSG